MRIIAMIGSMDHPELFERARRHLSTVALYLVPTEPPPLRAVHYERSRRASPLPRARPKPNAPRNPYRGAWHWAVDLADDVIVVRRPDGTLGPGTVEELRHARGKRKPIWWE